MQQLPIPFPEPVTEPIGEPVVVFDPHAGLSREAISRVFVVGEEWIESPVLCDVPGVRVREVAPAMSRLRRRERLR